jgi:hypothetical protein
MGVALCLKNTQQGRNTSQQGFFSVRKFDFRTVDEIYNNPTL